MDAATIGVFGAMITVMLTVMIYLDRARRADMVAGFAAIGRRFDRFEERVNRHFDQVDERFVRVDKRLVRVDERFDRVDERFDRVDERFVRVDKRFDRVDERFDRVDKRFDEFTGIVVGLAKDVGEVKGRLRDSKPVEAFSGVD